MAPDHTSMWPTRTLRICSCLFEAQKPFAPFLDALVGGSDFGAAPPGVAAATGAAAPPATFSPDPEPGQYDDEDDYRYHPHPVSKCPIDRHIAESSQRLSWLQDPGQLRVSPALQLR
jgi:hypothetical protein